MHCPRPTPTNREEITLNPVRYIDIDSTYRNRTSWPFPAHFMVTTPPSGVCDTMNGVTSQDPIVDGYPVISFIGDVITTAANFSGGTPNAPSLSLVESSVDNFFKGAIITDTTTNESSTIISYDGSSKVVFLSTPFSNNWSPADGYSITDPSTAGSIFMSAGPSFNNVYQGYYLVDITTGENRLIQDYNASSGTLTLATPFSGAWNITDSYEIRKDPNVMNSGSSSAMTKTQMLLDGAAAGLPNDYFKGSFIRITDPLSPIYNEIRPIIAYNGTTKLATVGPGFSQAVAAPIQYSILRFSRDNSSYINIQPTSRLDSGYYEIELITLILPNVELETATGARISFYPYVYVEFGNGSSGGTNNLIISNNPNSSRALFKCPIYDVVNPVSSSFVKVNSAGMKHTIRFNPYEDYVFRVFLPNGDLYKTTADTVSPIAPNPSLQLSATFAIKRIITHHNINNTPMMMR